MNKGQTVFAIHRSKDVFEGVLGDKVEAGAQGFYTRWGTAHTIYFRNGAGTVTPFIYSDENIFCTKEAAKKELFTRLLHFPRLRDAA